LVPVNVGVAQPIHMLTKDDVRDSAGGWWMLPSTSVTTDAEGINWVQEHFDTKNFNVKFFPWTDVLIWFVRSFIATFTVCAQHLAHSAHTSAHSHSHTHTHTPPHTPPHTHTHTHTHTHHRTHTGSPLCEKECKEGVLAAQIMHRGMKDAQLSYIRPFPRIFHPACVDRIFASHQKAYPHAQATAPQPIQAAWELIKPDGTPRPSSSSSSSSSSGSLADRLWC
jgi:hypothetical protein